MEKPIKKIYMIGICGVAMGSLAGMLKQSGYEVSGSDENVYPPMSTMLERWGIAARSGFSADNVGSPDMVIIGNAISRGNPEAEYVLNRRIPYMSMAQALSVFLLRDKEVIAVAGTHGKTTTTALLAHVLEVAGSDPSFFIGGVARNYDSNYKIGSGKYFVIEGDEYDSAFFEKVPKFTIYRPYHCILTSLEFDHADIYKNFDELKLWFGRLINSIPSEGQIVYSCDYDILAELVAKARSVCSGFGQVAGDFTYEVAGYENDHVKLKIRSDPVAFECSTQLFGHFNYQNILAASAMAIRLGIDAESIARAIESFDGVKRRQELIYDDGNLKIFEDFAHHPTAIGMVLSAMRERYKNSRIWAVYEPRSATSRRNIFQKELPEAFKLADRVLIKQPYRLDGIAEAERIDIAAVVDDINSGKQIALLFSRVDEMVDHIFGTIDHTDQNIIVIMSNGGFDGIYERIISRARDDIAVKG